MVVVLWYWRFVSGCGSDIVVQSGRNRIYVHVTVFTSTKEISCGRIYGNVTVNTST